MAMSEMKDCKCGKSFKLNGSLYNHIKTKHSGKYEDFKVQKTKRGRPRKQVEDVASSSLINKQQIERQQQAIIIELDPQGDSIVSLYDKQLLDSQSFRRMMGEFSKNYSHLINEKQTCSCDYRRASVLYETSRYNKVYLEIVGFVQMLLPNIQQNILHYCLDLLEQTKTVSYDSHEINQNLQNYLSKLISAVYKIPCKQFAIQSISSATSSPCLAVQGELKKITDLMWLIQPITVYNNFLKKNRREEEEE